MQGGCFCDEGQLRIWSVLLTRPLLSHEEPSISNNRSAVRELALLERPYRLAVTIFRDSIRAFADADYELARMLQAERQRAGLP